MAPSLSARRRAGSGDAVVAVRWLGLLTVCAAMVGCERKAAPPILKAAPLMAAEVSGVAEVQTGSQMWNAMTTNHPVWEGSVVRTGADSSVAMDSQVSADRIALGENSETLVERWKVSGGSATGVGEVALNLRRGVVVVDVPTLSGASIFEVKGSNFLASVRSGAAVAAITVDGFVLVRSGTVVCVFVSPSAKAVTLNAGEMVDPNSMSVKAIPAESNSVWNLLAP
jgi:hypothetical protein